MKHSLKEQYNKKIVPALEKELEIKNKHALPSVQKVVVNIGLGRASQAATFADKILPEIIRELAIITGQKPAIAAAKKSIAGFKLRQGQAIGLKVILRGNRMYDFIDRLVKMVYPRVRDFRGIDLKNVDKDGNLNLGFKDHFVFAEISQEMASVDFGLQVTLVTKARSRQDAIVLFKHLGFLFKVEKEVKGKKRQ